MPLVLATPELFANLYRERLAPWMTPGHSAYAGAIGAMFEQLYELVMDSGIDGEPGYVPGWGQLTDVDSCPTAFLPFLGQFVGVPNLIGVKDAVARGLIRSQVSMHRGTPASITAAAAATLTGSQTVTLTERYLGQPYAIQVITYTAETVNAAATRAAILTVKPAGIILTYSIYDGWIISLMEAFFTGQTISYVEGKFTSLTAYESHIS